ncbi:DUF2690 domain-containing protein [Actinoplanes sp. URMC 104]|uniref:DUF2690 domain-containing protein n=1 Tax=Actinoplanes sp. URMC 104 TaxID=3423409 RepID=UPI003F1CA35C
MNLRRIAATIATSAALATVAAVSGAPAASAAEPACGDGDRIYAEYWTSTDEFGVAAERTWVDGTSYNTVQLRFNDESQCAWGSYEGGSTVGVYLEYEEDGAVFQVDRQADSTTAYTGVWSDANPRTMRACADDAGQIFCTDWF